MKLEPMNQTELVKNIGTIGGSGERGTTVAGGTMERATRAARPLNNKLVPEEERLSTLDGMFDDKTLKRMGAVECVTCASRTYQDGSDDASVSFQSPTHISPEQAASAVMSHEMEHVSNEQQDAKNEGREVVSQSVQIFHSVCPECGRNYVSGGLTKTTTIGKSQNAYQHAKGTSTEGNLVDLEV